MKNSNYICDMKNKYNIYESVYDYHTKEIKTVKEFEVFDDMILYYFIEGGASPEKYVQHPNFKVMSDIISIPMEEKQKQINNVLETLSKELNELFL